MDDAKKALECGCDGIVVSNHGGKFTPVASVFKFSPAYLSP